MRSKSVYNTLIYQIILCISSSVTSGCAVEQLQLHTSSVGSTATQSANPQYRTTPAKVAEVVNADDITTNNKDTPESIQSKIDKLNEFKDKDPNFGVKRDYLNSVRNNLLTQELEERRENDIIQCEEVNAVHIENWKRLHVVRENIKHYCTPIQFYNGGAMFLQPDPDAFTSHDRIVEYNGYLEFREKNPFVIQINNEYVCPKDVLKKNPHMYDPTYYVDEDGEKKSIDVLYIAKHYMHSDPSWIGTRPCVEDMSRNTYYFSK